MQRACAFTGVKGLDIDNWVNSGAERLFEVWFRFIMYVSICLRLNDPLLFDR